MLCCALPKRAEVLEAEFVAPFRRSCMCQEQMRQLSYHDRVSYHNNCPAGSDHHFDFIYDISIVQDVPRTFYEICNRCRIFDWKFIVCD